MMSVIVICLYFNRLDIQLDETPAQSIRASFSHPRSLIGHWQLLQQSASVPIAQWRKKRAWWQLPELLHLVWVLPPQTGGLLDLERRALRELTHSVFSGRVYGYVVESEPLNYAHWQATIPTLVRL